MDYNKEARETLFGSFVRILEELSEIISQLIEAETAKATAASAREDEKMDSFLKEEQALLLKLRGLEQQREHMADRLGWKNMTFRQILKTADEKESSALSPLFMRMEKQLKDLADAKDSSSRIITVRLREFEHILGAGSLSGFPEADSSPHFHDRYV